MPGGKDIGIQLLDAVRDGNIRRVQAALEAGANVNGHPRLPFAPIVMATVANQAGIVRFLLEQGADPDRPVAVEVSFPSLGMVPKTVLGERALHIAARSRKVEIVRLLLKRSCADPNATDNGGDSPLMVTCKPPDECVEVVRLLLEAGADPALAEEEGFIPLHIVAHRGHMDVVDMLHARAPATLNRRAGMGQTPLFVACGAGNESMVSKLLSLGAMERTPLDEDSTFPLQAAVIGDSIGVLRVMINEGGLRAVGGDVALADALCMAVKSRRARALRLLLAADGEEGRSRWANISIDGRRLLHSGAGFCYPAAVSVLLEEGADETARDSDGRLPRDVIGVDLGRDGEPQMDWEEELAIRRMLQRGPAYRARSWAWPSDEKADAGGSGGDTAAAAAAAVLSSPPAVPKAPVVDVRIVRTTKSNRKSFVRLVGRYCAKD